MNALRYITPLAVAASALAIALAPTAAATASPGCINTGTAMECVSPGNAQVTAWPGPVALQAGMQQYPFYGRGLPQRPYN